MEPDRIEIITDLGRLRIILDNCGHKTRIWAAINPLSWEIDPKDSRWRHTVVYGSPVPAMEFTLALSQALKNAFDDQRKED